MATAAAVLEWKQDEQQPITEPAQVVAWEAPPRGASRLLEAQRKEISEEIAHAKEILNQQMEGELYSAETLDRAVAFLKGHIEGAWRAHAAKVPIPVIGSGPSGSVDLYWEQPTWKLLVNIPADKDASATFYGDDYGRQKTKGSLDPDTVSIAIVAWLMS